VVEECRNEVCKIPLLAGFFI